MNFVNGRHSAMRACALDEDEDVVAMCATVQGPVAFHRSTDELAPGVAASHRGHTPGAIGARAHSAGGWCSRRKRSIRRDMETGRFSLRRHSGRRLECYEGCADGRFAPAHLPGHDPCDGRYPAFRGVGGIAAVGVMTKEPSEMRGCPLMLPYIRGVSIFDTLGNDGGPQ